MDTVKKKKKKKKRLICPNCGKAWDGMDCAYCGFDSAPYAFDYLWK